MAAQKCDRSVIGCTQSERGSHGLNNNAARMTPVQQQHIDHRASSCGATVTATKRREQRFVVGSEASAVPFLMQGQ